MNNASIFLRFAHKYQGTYTGDLVTTWHKFSRASAVCCVLDGRRDAYCHGVEYPRPFMRQYQPRSPPGHPRPCCVVLLFQRRRSARLSRLYVRRILTRLCLQNTISRVGKAKIKADINPLTILTTPCGYRFMNSGYLWHIKIFVLFITFVS